MFTRLCRFSRRLAAEAALLRHNQNNRRGVVDSGAQTVHLLPDVLDAATFQGLLAALQPDSPAWVRSETAWRRGAAIGGHELLSGPAATEVRRLFEGPFLQQIRARTGLSALQWVPELDTNRFSALCYEGPASGEVGDGIDWHVDGSIYLGERWAGILTLLEDTHDRTAKLELEPAGQLLTLPSDGLANSLALFRGDHVRHRVRPMAPGERRVVLSLLFSTWPVRTLNPLLRRYQSRINQTFYGNPAP